MSFFSTLIEQNLIPEDVTIQVLTQAREHIIRKTFEAIERRLKNAIVHVYNSTSRFPERAGIPQIKGGDPEDRRRRSKTSAAADGGS